jgi:hypothetical protein
MLDNRIDEVKATDLFYNSETFARLADESAGYYKKSWTEIYEMLKKELKMLPDRSGFSGELRVES